MTGSQPTIAASLNDMLQASGLPLLDPDAAARLEAFYSLLVRWNRRINLTAIRSEAGILSRHFVESIAVARCLPAGIASLLDFGSGAGFPGLPIAICCPQIAVLLAESQARKAAFLREAVRTVGIPVEVFSGRAETLARTFDCVVLRAVDRMGQAVAASASLVSANGWLALLTTLPMVEQSQALADPGFAWSKALPLPSAESRVVLLGKKS